MAVDDLPAISRQILMLVHGHMKPRSRRYFSETRLKPSEQRLEERLDSQVEKENKINSHDGRPIPPDRCPWQASEQGRMMDSRPVM